MKKYLGLILLCLLLCVAGCTDSTEADSNSGAADGGIFGTNAGDQNTIGGYCGDNVTWSLNTDTGELTISGKGEMEDYDVLFNDNDVPLSIYYQCHFAPWNGDCSSIKAVIIDNGVTSIGGGAFYNCSELTSITIPDSVTSIGRDAFYGCTGLQNAVGGQTYIQANDNPYFCLQSVGQPAADCAISSQTRFIGSRAFSGSRLLTSITIPDSVTSIGEDAFADCGSLTAITIPDSVTSIGSGAFSGCTGLQNVVGDLIYIKTTNNPYFYLQALASQTITSCEISDDTRFIDNYAFSDCKALQSIKVNENNVRYSNDEYGILFNKDKTSLLQYPAGNTCTEYTIPNSATSIGDYAFSGCSSVTLITIPDSVISIGNYAFSGCSNLSSIEIGNGVTSIGDYAFSGCSNLNSIKIGNSVTNIGEGTFSNCSSLNAVYITNIATWCKAHFENYDDNSLYHAYNLYLNGTLVTDLVIPDSVTNIGNDAFHGCSSLTSITIPDSVTNIGDDAFHGCSSLTSITIPDSVTNIGDDAFCGCNSLTSIAIPDSVTSIGDGAFSYCSSLASITIPDSVTSIGKAVFSGCTGLQNTVGDLIYIKTTDNPYFYLQGVNSKKIADCTINDGTRFIGENALSGCSSLTSITIPSSVTSIGVDAFSGCSSLKAVYITDIAAWCKTGFYSVFPNPRLNSYNLYLNGALVTDLVIPDGVTNISARAFYNCGSLTSITISDSVTSIDSGAFWDCRSMTSVKIGNGVTSIGSNVFYNCSSLTSVTIPDSVTSIGNYAFSSCSNLTSVKIGNGVTSIGSNVLYNCSSLTSIMIPDSVTSIEDEAFRGCSSLTIYGTLGSSAEAYAKQNGIPFDAIG